MWLAGFLPYSGGQAGGTRLPDAHDALSDPALLFIVPKQRLSVSARYLSSHYREVLGVSES